MDGGGKRQREIKRSSGARGRAMCYVPQSCMMLPPHHNMKAVETKIRILYYFIQSERTGGAALRRKKFEQSGDESGLNRPFAD